MSTDLLPPAANEKTAFVTVGTTKFEELIKAIDKRSFADALLAAGFMRLVIQKGDGQFRPCNILPHAHIWNVLDNGLYVECFNFRPSLEKELATASLVISHAGSGSIFESLGAGRPLIVVPNPLLMDNHQAELAEALAAEGYVAAAAPDTDELLAALQRVVRGELRPYKKGDATGIVRAIDKMMGFAP